MKLSFQINDSMHIDTEKYKSVYNHNYYKLPEEIAIQVGTDIMLEVCNEEYNTMTYYLMYPTGERKLVFQDCCFEYVSEPTIYIDIEDGVPVEQQMWT